MRFAIAGATIFDGSRMLEGHAVIVDGASVAGVLPAADIPRGVPVRRVEGLLAPGFIDIQVNGGSGVLFNDAPTVEAIRTIGAAHRRFGTTGFLPTLISDTREKMAEAVEAVRQGLEQGVPGLLGIHLEGPFLNPEKKGAHHARYMRPIESEDIRIITSLGAGRTLVTLAPEMVPLDLISRLAEAGVIVSAGHTAASYETLREATKLGLRGYTHLFNAMPPLMSRAPGPVGAALSNSAAYCSVIVDFQHVSAPALQVALQARALATTVLITDAMAVAGTDLKSFALQGRTIYRRDGKLVLEDGTLAGSDLDMAMAVKNCIEGLSLSDTTAIAMATLNPAAFLRLDHEIGRIMPGHCANFVLLDEGYRVVATWIDGSESEAAGGN
jgi:N-acetylglucosamine-6-phosphate deacetylase